MGTFSSHDPWPGPQACLDSWATEFQTTVQAPDPEETQSLFPLWGSEGKGSRASSLGQKRYSQSSSYSPGIGYLWRIVCQFLWPPSWIIILTTSPGACHFSLLSITSFRSLTSSWICPLFALLSLGFSIFLCLQFFSCPFLFFSSGLPIISFWIFIRLIMALCRYLLYAI